MGDSVGQIDLDLHVNQSAFNNEMNSIGSNASGSMTSAFGKLGMVIAGAFAVKKLFDFGQGAIQLASDLNEVQNVVDVTFGSMSSQIDAFSQNAVNKFGLSELSAKKFTSTMGAMLKSGGITGQQLVNVSEGVTGLAADLASFYNLSQQDAFDKIRSGMVGMARPLEELGVNMSAANLQAFMLTQGMHGQFDALSQANQELIRYKYLISVTKDAQGDFARTSHSWANETRVMGEQWKIFQGTMGQGFINMLTPVLTGLNYLIAKLQIASKYFEAFTVALFGSQRPTKSVSTSLDAATASSDKLGASTAKTAAALKNSLSAFDQLNVIGQTPAGGAGAGAVGGEVPVDATPITPTVDTTKIASLISMLGQTKIAAKEIADFFSKSFGPPISKVMGEILPVLTRWRAALFSTFDDLSQLGTPLANWFVNDLIPGMEVWVETTGHIFAGILDSALLVFSSLEPVIMPILDTLVTSILPMFTSMGVGITQITGSWFDATKHVFDTLWVGVMQPGLMLASHMLTDILGIMAKTWLDHGNGIVTGVQGYFKNLTKLFDDLWKVFLKPIVDNMLKEFSNLWDNHLKALVSKIADFVGELVQDVLEITNKFILPLVNAFVNVLGPPISKVVNFMVSSISAAIGTIADVVGVLVGTFKGIIDFITGVFTGNWGKAWNGVAEIFGSIFGGLVSAAKTPLDLIIDAINIVINAIDSMNFDFPSVNILGKTIGGSHFGIKHIDPIPHLANGGLVHAPTLAMVGDNRGASTDPEVISPLSKLKSMMGSGDNSEVIELLKKMLDLLNQGQGDTVIKVDGIELGRASAKGINRASRQDGVSLLIV